VSALESLPDHGVPTTRLSAWWRRTRLRPLWSGESANRRRAPAVQPFRRRLAPGGRQSTPEPEFGRSVASFRRGSVLQLNHPRGWPQDGLRPNDKGA
jgi:hypothetical protein